MPADTRSELLASAERAARARGFDGFSYADLADEVGIRKASIHHHFATKAALSVAVMERYATAIRDACAEIEQGAPTAAGRLAGLILLYRGSLKDGKSLCLCVSFSASRESLPPEVIGQIGQFRAMVIQWLTGVFELGQQDGTIRDVKAAALEAAATLPLLEGAQLGARAEENVALFDSAVALLSARLAA